MYRKDINCLRGLSILFITFYHFFPNIYFGGFIGVDILFCISGYLIYYSLSSKKNLSSLSFYSNRIKRISPPQVIVLAIILYAYNDINPIDYDDLCLEGFNSIIFNLNNYYQWKNLDYLSQDKGKFSSPLLHFWTLSIEFQFYIISPIALMLLKNNMLMYIFFLFCTLLYSTYYTKLNYVNSYFSSIIRLADFLTGILSINAKKFNLKYSKAILLVIIFLFILTKSFINNYPGIIILLPLSFTFLYLSTSNENFIINSIFLDYIGTISYSLYLVHYPFTFNKHKLENITLMLCISIIFFNLIEKKCRNIPLKSIYTILGYVIFIFIYYISTNKLKHLKYKSNNASSFNSVWNYNSRIVTKCILTDKNYNFTNIKSYILLIGDSHIQHFFPAINYFLQKKNISALAILFWGDRIINHNYMFLKAVFRLLDTPSLIILSFKLSNFQSLFNVSKFNENFSIFITYLKRYCSNILLLEETPDHSYNPNKVIYSNSKSFCIININCTITNYSNLKNMNVTLIQIRSLFCNKNKCNDVINSTLVYADANHITLEFSLKLKEYFYNILSSQIYTYNSKYLLSECVISRKEWHDKFVKDFSKISIN